MDDRSNHYRFQKEMIAHMDVIYNYALYLTGNRDEANDLVQETYLKAYRFFDKFEQGTNAKAWLYRIMRNTYINEYRRLKRIPDMVEYDEQVSAPQLLATARPQRTDFRGTMEGEMFDDDISVAILSLPEKFRTVVVLRDVEDLPYEEIAEALEIPVGTVRSRLHRARAILYSRLKEYARSRGYRVNKSPVPAEYALAG